METFRDEPTVLADLWAASAGQDVALGRAQRAEPWSPDGQLAAFELGLDGLVLALERRIADPPAAPS